VKPDKPLTPSALPPDTGGSSEEKPNGPRLPPRFSKKRLAAAFAIAAAADIIGAFLSLTPPVAWVADMVTAVLLFAVLGLQWMLLPGLVLEAIPGVAVLPFWLLVVGGIAVWGTPRPKLRPISKVEQ
jgi:hypothetical protein